MVEQLHNILNTILGIEKLNIYNIFYELNIVNNSKYVIELYSDDNKIKPKRISLNNKYTYNLASGIYKLYAYTDNDERALKYYSEFYVSENMYGRFKNIKI